MKVLDMDMTVKPAFLRIERLQRAYIAQVVLAIY